MSSRVWPGCGLNQHQPLFWAFGFKTGVLCVCTCWLCFVCGRTRPGGLLHRCIWGCGGRPGSSECANVWFAHSRSPSGSSLWNSPALPPCCLNTYKHTHTLLLALILSLALYLWIYTLHHAHVYGWTSVIVTPKFHQTHLCCTLAAPWPPELIATFRDDACDSTRCNHGYQFHTSFWQINKFWNCCFIENHFIKMEITAA